MTWKPLEDFETVRAELVPRLTALRQDLHRHPELGFEEVRTQGIVMEWLRELGFEPRKCASTGVVADLRPDRSDQARTLALRADLDCLPMPETTDLPYRSVHEGRAHKCGHDGHTSILLGVASVLARGREEAPANIRLLFQPAEEGVRGGGARVMVEEGALSGVGEVYGLHNWPGYPRGEVRVRAGATMAQVHTFEIVIVGVGGHGSQPQLCKDPIVAGSHLVSALQTIVARELGYEGGAVVSVTAFLAGTTVNVIPATARLLGTIRTFEPHITRKVIQRFQDIVRQVGKTFEVEMRLDLTVGYPVLESDAGCAAAVERVAARVVGPDRVSGRDLPMAGGEDFAYFAAARPGAYFFLGAGKEGEQTPVCHHPDFDFDDALIPLGIQMFLGICEDRLKAGESR